MVVQARSAELNHPETLVGIQSSAAVVQVYGMKCVTVLTTVEPQVQQWCEWVQACFKQAWYSSHFLS